MISVVSSVLVASLVFNLVMEPDGVQNDVWAVKRTLNTVKWLSSVLSIRILFFISKVLWSTLSP